MSNNNISDLDLAQMHKRTLDSSLDAQRVVVVGQDLNIDNTKLIESIKEGISSIKIDIPKNEQIVGPTVQIIEVPRIMTEYKILEVEKPIVITEYKTIEVIKQVEVPVIHRIEVPIVVKETQIVEVQAKNSKLDKVFIILNLILLAILIAK